MIAILTFIAVNTDAQMVLAVGQNNVLYIGAENYIHLGLNKYDVNAITLVASKGSLTNKGDGFYSWRVCSDSVHWVRFKCFLRSNMTKAVDSVSFQVKLAPKPVVFVAPSALEFNDPQRRPQGVRATMDTDFTADLPFKIQEYVVEIVKMNGDTISFKNIGYRFTSEVFQAIYSLKKGDKYRITKATAINDCEVTLRKLEDTSFYIIK